MDDFGFNYQTQEWSETCEEFLYSMNTFGLFDDMCIDICIEYCMDYAKQDI